MTVVSVLTSGILSIVAALLVIAALGDIQARKITNRLNVSIMVAALIYLFLNYAAGAPFMAAVAWPVITAVGVFLVLALLFAVGGIGGGDVKLLAAVALIAGPKFLFALLFITALVGGLIALLQLVQLRLKARETANAASVSLNTVGRSHTAGITEIAHPQGHENADTDSQGSTPNTPSDTGGQNHAKPLSVPYGVAIAVGGLWVCAQRAFDIAA